MEHGTILKYLQDHGRGNVDKLVRFGLHHNPGRANKISQLHEVAQGLQYLHSRNIVHGDLRGVRGFLACLQNINPALIAGKYSDQRGLERVPRRFWAQCLCQCHHFYVHLDSSRQSLLDGTGTDRPRPLWVQVCADEG
jgi:hypothetical protein